MKNNLKTTEELLQKGKTIGLSVSERDEIKSELLSYARFHGVKEKSQKSFFGVSNIWMRSFASASFVFMLFVGTGYASASSLPGDFLYPVKTNLVEELSAMTKTTPLSQLEYHHYRYRERLSELNTLAKDGQISIAALYDSQTELAELSEEIDALMHGEDAIDDIVALELVGDMVGMSNAAEALVRESATEEEQSAFENITDSIEQVHDDEINDLLDNGTSTVAIFIQNQLLEISDELNENDLGEVTKQRVIDFVEDADISLKDENYEAVVNSVTDAVTLIKSKVYETDHEDEVVE